MERLGAPAYALDLRGMVRWLNQAAVDLVGDVRGRPFTNVLAPYDVSRLRQQFARKLTQGDSSDFEFTLITKSGSFATVGASSTALFRGGQVVGLFGLMTRPALSEREPPPAAERLTARQLEVLQLIAAGRKTAEIAQQLDLSVETVRNHARGIRERLAVHSRLDAVRVARRDGLIPEESQSALSLPRLQAESSISLGSSADARSPASSPRTRASK